MDVPKYVFSNYPVPPPKNQQRAHVFDLNKPSNVPIVKNGCFRDVLNPSADNLFLDYSLTAANQARSVLRPFSTCLPIGRPNSVANLQDVCSGSMPFAIQSQEWIRQYSARAPVGRPKGKSKKKRFRKGSDEDLADSVEVREENLHATPTATKKTDNGGELKTKDYQEEVDEDLDLPFIPLPRLPDFRYFKPSRFESAKLNIDSKRAAIYCGFDKMPLLNSPVNWWFSGGCLEYVGVSDKNGFMLRPSGPSMSVLEALPLNVTKNPSFQQVECDPSFSHTVNLCRPVYQICSQVLEDVGEKMIYVRHLDSISVLRMEETDEWRISGDSLINFPVLKGQYFTHVAPSPYVIGEVLTAQDDGSVCLVQVDGSRCLERFDVRDMEFKKSAKYSWTGCYVGNHLRMTCVGTPAGLEMFDRRLKFDKTRSQIRLIAKSNDVNGVTNDIVAADICRGSGYHMALTTKELVFIDERFPTCPAIRYPSQSASPPLYLHSVSGIPNQTTDWVLTGSQMSQRVTCYEMTRFSDSSDPSCLASLPFLCASPRQLIPQAVSCNSYVDFTMKQRLEKPLIGISCILPSDGQTVTVAMVTSLGDLFIQPFGCVSADDYEPDGTATFASVHPDVVLNEEESQYLTAWLSAASRDIPDHSMANFFRPFIPPPEAVVTEELSALAERCSKAVKCRADPECLRCKPGGDDEPEKDRPLSDRICPRCKAPVKYSFVVQRRTGPNRFCFVEENDSGRPVDLPEHLDTLMARTREMGLTNRIVWKILAGHGEELSTANLLPESTDMPPPILKKRTRKSSLQQMQIEAFLTNTDPEPDEAGVSVAEGNETSRDDLGGQNDTVASLSERFDPLAVSTQAKKKKHTKAEAVLPEVEFSQDGLVDTGEVGGVLSQVEPEPVAVTTQQDTTETVSQAPVLPVKPVKSTKKAKRISGF